MRRLDYPQSRHPAPLLDPCATSEDSSRDRGTPQASRGSLTWVHDSLAPDHHRLSDTTPRLPAPSARLGRYRLIEPLARGGQGEVWMAVQVEPVVELVALKLLPPEHALEPRRLARLRREASRGARLDDPALLPVYEFGVERGIAYLVMPWVDGFTLADILDQRRRCHAGAPPPTVHRLALLPEPQYPREVVRSLARVARALHSAHAARVAHRDVKPQNILLDRHHDGRVFLIDFGMGRDLDAVTPQQLRDRAGTPLYMAPERLLGGPADEVTCDVYSLGVTLFEAVTLEAPWAVPRALPLAAWSAYLAGTEPRRLRAVRPGLPADLEAIVARAMARDPGRRHPSAAALAADLDHFLDGAPASASDGDGPR